MSRRVGLLILAIALIAVIAAIWLRPSSNPTGRQRITIAQFGDFFLYAPVYVAVDAGFFNSEGLDVSIINTGGDDKSWAAIIGGNADFGVADPTFVAIANERGQAGTLIASIVAGVPFWGVTLDPQLKDIADVNALAGKTIGTFPSPSTAYALQRRMLDEAGIKASIREVAPGGLLPLLRSGQLDVALELEPSVSTAVATGAFISYSLADRYKDFAITGLTTLPDTCTRQPELCRKVTCALQKALISIRSNPQEAASILAKRFPEIPPATGASALDRVVKADIVPPSVVVPESAWRAALELRQRLGEINDVSRALPLLNNTFAQQAAGACHP
jgi:NitT/TauT family transport system substrate-binding protein